MCTLNEQQILKEKKNHLKQILKLQTSYLIRYFGGKKKLN